MSSITIKNIPRHLHLAYKRRAKQHARSLQAEILYTLGQSVDYDEAEVSVEEVAGMLKPRKSGVTLSEMDSAVSDMFKKQWKR